MDQFDDDPLNAGESPGAKAFADLPRDVIPAPDLEGRVVAAVRSGRGSMQPDRPAAAARWMLVAAAAVVFFAGFSSAWFVRAQQASTPPAIVTGSRYLLLLYDNPGTATADPANQARLVAEYTDWFTRERAAGVVESGDELAADARALGPALAPSPAPSGLFVVHAASLDDAVAVGQRCPHVRYGGSIVVRPIAR